MGTMIQALKRSPEADFRGERFADHDHDAAWQQRPVVPDAPGHHRRHPPRLPRCRVPTSSRPTPSIRPRSVPRADYGLEELAYELNLASARIARARGGGRRGRRAHPDKPRFVAGVLGPDQPHGVDLAGRQRSRLYQQRRLRRAGRRPTPRRLRGLVDGGADFILVETIFDTLNAKAAIFAISKRFDEPGAPAGHDLRHHHRPQRADPVRADHRGLLELRAARQAR